MSSILEVFETNCKHVVFDVKLVSSLVKLMLDFMTKNQNHIQFFGGNLTGVQIVRFTPSDNQRLFNEILLVDDVLLEAQLHALPTINKDFNVSSDVFNLSCMWIIHRLLTSPHLKKEQMELGAVSICKYLFFKFLTSRMVQHFPNPTTEAQATATYNALSNKFGLKKYQNWGKLLDVRARGNILEGHENYKKLVSFKSDKQIVDILNSLQGMIRSILKKIYNVHKQQMRAGVKVTSTGTMIEIDGDIIMRERTKGLQMYLDYIERIFSNKADLIKPELVEIIMRAMENMSEKMFIQTLVWASDNYTEGRGSLAANCVNNTIEHAFSYFANNPYLVGRHVDLPKILGKLKGVYGNGRTSDALLINARNDVEKLVTMATGTRTPSTIAALRSGFMLYIVLRALAMRSYKA